MGQTRQRDFEGHQRRKLPAATLALAILLGFSSQVFPEPKASATDDDLDELSLEELMSVPITSASRIVERLNEAPATVIVIDREQINERGYSNVSELLADLPGMDFVRPHGATYFKNYWRGFRNTIGSPYLLMLDDTILNHLYFNTTDVMLALPLSNIERIEVVSGPASSVYGPNAFMGVIQIVTRADQDFATARVEMGDEELTTFDGAASWMTGDWRFRVAARFSESEMDPSMASRSAYSDPSLLEDRRLWGGFLDDPGLAGRFSSPERFSGFDLRIDKEGLEIAAQGFETRTGYGLEYALDQAQPHAVWDRFDYSVFARYRRELSERVDSTTLLRYRSSGVGDDSTFVEAFETVVEGVPTRVVDFSRWYADNSSFALFQDLQIEWNEQTSLSTGLKYERKDLQKAYEVVYGPSLPPEDLILDSYPFPAEGDQIGPAYNRIDTDDVGFYAQARHRWSEHHTGHLGVRWDDNSAYGSALTLRLGYVGSFGPWIFKALYGEAFQEPNPRVLYGGWRGSGSDPELDPESSETTEVSLNYTRAKIRHAFSLYSIENQDTIVNVAGGATNLGARNVQGLDYHFEALPFASGGQQLRLWLYYTHLFEATEEKFDDAMQNQGNRPIGDIAEDQAHLGLTGILGPWTSTLTAHWVDSRGTVETNPVESIDSSLTTDIYLRYAFRSGLGLRSSLSVGVKARNLFDEQYAHPGVRDAAGGNTPGFFDASGLWVGADGFYNSILPQPGRQLSFVLSFSG